MNAPRLLATLASLAVLSIAPAALADAADAPCDGLDEGAACTTVDDEEGTCEETDSGFLDCVAGGEATGEDDGCAVQAPGRKGATRAAAGLVFLASALAAARRWRRRGGDDSPRG